MTGDGRGDKRGQTGVRMDEEEKVDFGTTSASTDSLCMVSCCLSLLSVGANSSSVVLLPQKW